MSQAMRLKARMKQIAQEDHLSAQVVLQNFMLERLLERISLSQYKDDDPQRRDADCRCGWTQQQGKQI